MATTKTPDFLEQLLADREEASIRDYFRLLKPGVMSLVVFTGFVGMKMAPGELHPFLQLLTVLCIAMGSGAGAAINMWFDRDIDAQMRRTKQRPIPAGRIHPDDALFLGLFLSVISVMLLGLAAGWTAAGMLALAIVYYAVFYTMWLKRATPQNIVIGGGAGAFPPVIGWLAVTGDAFTIEPWLYFLIIFLWTPPHFWALALYRSDDYRNARVPMLPVVAGIPVTKRHMLAYTLLLIPATLAPTLLGHSGLLYATGALVLGVRFFHYSLVVLRSDEPSHAMAMFKYSILYLFALFSLLLIDKWVDFAQGILLN